MELGQEHFTGVPKDSNLATARFKRTLEDRCLDEPVDTDVVCTDGDGEVAFSGQPPTGPTRPQPLQQEPSYKTEHDATFTPTLVESMTRDVLVEKLNKRKYEPASCKQLSQELAARIMERLKCLQVKRYKMVAVVSIGSMSERPGLQFGSRCLWNQSTDSFTSVKFTNGSLFAVAMIYSLYYD